jgi:hypothetical protein
MTNPTLITSIAATIAAQLGETAPGARATIWRIVRTIGVERTQAFVAQAQEVEAKGGMLVPDGSRKRTLGGIFFYLVRTQISDDEAIRINRAWRWQQWKRLRQDWDHGNRSWRAEPASATQGLPLGRHHLAHQCLKPSTVRSSLFS